MTKRFPFTFYFQQRKQYYRQYCGHILGQYQVAEKLSLKPEIILNKISEEVCKEPNHRINKQGKRLLEIRQACMMCVHDVWCCCCS